MRCAVLVLVFKKIQVIYWKCKGWEEISNVELRETPHAGGQVKPYRSGLEKWPSTAQGTEDLWYGSA